MKRQFLSIILSVTLLASAIAGAISVSIKTAFADDSSGDFLYWADFKSQMLEIAQQNLQVSTMFDILTEVETLWDDPTFNVFIIMDPNDNISLLSLKRTNGTDFQGKGWQGPLEYQLSTGSFPSYFREEGIFKYYNGSFSYINNSSSNISNPSARRSLIDFATVNDPDVYYPTPFEFDATGWHCYSLHGMVSGNTNGYSMSGNILPGHYVPPVVEFEWLKYNVGDRWFITPKDQTWTYGLRNDGEGSYNAIYITLGYDYAEPSISDAIFTDFTDYISTPAILAPGAENVIDDTVYGFEITDFLDLGLSYIGYSWINRETENSSGEVLNRVLLAEFDGEFNVKLSAQEENASLNEAWEQITNYYNSYNNTHVVPQNLGEVLFGLNGSQMYPCNISVPATVWDNSPEADGGTSAAPIHNWKWWYPSGNDVNIGFNYDLFDTVILTYSSSGEYTLINYYDDTLTNPFMAVSNLTFDQIVNQFDIVIIVPDDDGCLSNSWWKTVMNTILNNLGADLPFDFLNTQAIAGSGSQGIEHISSRPDRNAHILQGFAILTYKAIQKQQLWNFNDGITKLYQLQVDYIESEDLWKDSFLLWSSSVFNMLNSLDGRLTTINTNLLSISSLLESIKTAVDNMVTNDDPDNLQPWYLSLWNWITNFRPSDSDFSATLNQYDNNWEDFPELPAPSTVPLLPGGE